MSTVCMRRLLCLGVLGVLAVVSPALAVPFDAIVPEYVRINTTSNIGVSFGYWGWIAATSATISASDLQNATFALTIADPAIVVPNEGTFLNETFLASLAPTEVAGQRLPPQNSVAYDPLLLPGETLKKPSIPLWFVQFEYATGYASTTTFDASLTMGTETVSYSGNIEFGAFSDFTIVEGQRLSAPAIPEPGTLLLLGSGLAGLGAWARRRRAPVI